MRVFVSGVLAGCLSSAGVLLAHSFWERNDDVNYKLDEESSHLHAHLNKPQEELGVKGKNSARIQQVLALGRPSEGRIQRHYQNHVLEYDCAGRIPVWVAEHLSRQHLKGDAERRKSEFKMDPEIPVEFSSKNSDYKGSGWSRGHMSPAGDSKRSQEAMDETFYLTNILPQDINNNGGFWNRLEIFCRDLTDKYDDVWITSGPVFLPTVNEEGKKMVSYEVLGESEVAVPTHLYKVVVAQNTEEVTSGAFIVPNVPLDYSHHLKDFQVPLEQLEKKVGTKFYSNLNRDETRNLCEATGCNLMTKDQMNEMIYSSRLKYAGNLKKLDKVWTEIKEKKITITPKLEDLYQKRLNNLSGPAEVCEGTSTERAAEKSSRATG